MHDRDILLPAAGHQDHDAQSPDYCNYLPHGHVNNNNIKIYSAQIP